MTLARSAVADEWGKPELVAEEGYGQADFVLYSSGRVLYREGDAYRLARLSASARATLLRGLALDRIGHMRSDFGLEEPSPECLHRWRADGEYRLACMKLTMWERDRSDAPSHAFVEIWERLRRFSSQESTPFARAPGAKLPGEVEWNPPPRAHPSFTAKWRVLLTMNDNLVFALYNDSHALYATGEEQWAEVKLSAAERDALLDGLALDRINDLRRQYPLAETGACVRVLLDNGSQRACIEDRPHLLDEGAPDAAPELNTIIKRFAHYRSPAARRWFPTWIGLALQRSDAPCKTVGEWPSSWPKLYRLHDHEGHDDASLVARDDIDSPSWRR